MRIFKNEIFRRVSSLVLLIFLVFAFDYGLGIVLEPVTYATYFNHDTEMIEKSGQTVDLLFVGASKVYRSFVPEVFEDELGLNCVVNAGSSAQPICGTYYELKDLVERLHPEKVFLDVTWDKMLKEANLQGRLIVCDRLSCWNRFLMGLNCFKLNELLYMSNAYRFRENFSLSSMDQILREKEMVREADYVDYSDTEEYYADTGFVYNYDTYETGTIPIRKKRVYSDDKILSENLEYLNACVDLCRENDIEVALVSSILSVMRLYSIENYQDAVDFYQNYAAQKGIDFYNLDYLKGREDLLPDEMMHDYNHVNGEGAYVVSKLFADILKAEEFGEDVSSFFYPDFSSFQEDVHRIVAVKAKIKNAKGAENAFRASITSLQNEDIVPRYRVLIRVSESDPWEVAAGWTSKNMLDFSCDMKKPFFVRVEAGTEDPSYGIASQVYFVEPENL